MSIIFIGLQNPIPLLYYRKCQRPETDKLFKPHAVRQCYDTMHLVWDSQGVGDRLETHLLPQGHEMPKNVQKMTLDFLDKHLK